MFPKVVVLASLLSLSLSACAAPQPFHIRRDVEARAAEECGTANTVFVTKSVAGLAAKSSASAKATAASSSKGKASKASSGAAVTASSTANNAAAKASDGATVHKAGATAASQASSAVTVNKAGATAATKASSAAAANKASSTAAGKGGVDVAGKGGKASSSSAAGKSSTTENAAAASSAAAAADAASTAAALSAAAAAEATVAPATANNGNAQDSTTLSPQVIATGFEQNGQAVAEAGQVASATSTNNFINFCLTQGNLPITNGQQIQTGSCNPAPMGVIAATTNMPSAKFVNPANMATIPANQNFTIQMAISNLDTGNFVNPDTNFFAAPQTVNSQGNIVGHSHVVIEKLNSLTQTTPTDPTVFAFFKGLNDAAENGVLSATVTGGLPAGAYRMASINSAANHQPVLVAVAQHGSLDDMVYFTVQ